MSSNWCLDFWKLQQFSGNQGGDTRTGASPPRCYISELTRHDEHRRCAPRHVEAAVSKGGFAHHRVTGLSQDRVQLESHVRQRVVAESGLVAGRVKDDDDHGIVVIELVTHFIADRHDDHARLLIRPGVEERQALLEAPSLDTRRETLVTLMEVALRGDASLPGERMQ